MFKYEIHTTIPRNFDPDVEGVTLVSILETSEGYVSHSIPLNKGHVVIRLKTSGEPEWKYLIDQLNDNFKHLDEDPSVVRRVVRKDL